MSYLLRARLPDVPGSLGRLASAIGASGGNIDAIEIVSREDGFAVDDVFLVAEPGVMPDSIVSACTSVDGVEVLWISRYAAGTNLFLDLEAVESMTEEPALALATLVELTPEVFRVDFGMLVQRSPECITVLHSTSAAPNQIPEGIDWPEDDETRELEIGDLLVAGAPAGPDQMVVLGRRGGPAFLHSEIARLDHLVGLARSISRHAKES